MKVKLAFYKAKGNWIDLLIRVFTNSPYSHVEIVLDKDWYSSSPRDGGVRIKQIVDDGNSWDFIEVDIDKERLYKKYHEYRDNGYDFKAILLSNILPIGIHSKDKMTCSEFVADVLGYSEPEKYSPRDVYKKINI
jgi:hypothetical protein